MSGNGVGLGGFMRRTSSVSAGASHLSQVPVPPQQTPSSSPSAKMDYVKLQSRNSSTFPPPHRTQLPPRLHSSLNPGAQKPSHLYKTCQRRCWQAVALFITLTILLYVLSLVKGYGHFGRPSKEYAIVIDAGSTGSRLHVFPYTNQGQIPLVGLSDQELPSLKTKPGLSSFATNPGKAGDSLVQLLAFAREHVLEKDRRKARLYLMATAGLRRLEEPIQEAILESCRAVLRLSGFMFKDEWASVIKGTEEGVYAWVAANYALGTLGNDKHETTGIIELGGASAQVTFVPDSPPPPEFLYFLNLGGITYNLYAYSFLHFGQEAAWESLFQLLIAGSVKAGTASSSLSGNGVVLDPCTPKGYSRSPETLISHTGGLVSPEEKIRSVLPAGNFSECRKAALDLLEKGKDGCLYQKCAIGSIFTPELRGKFFATENFFYTSEFFGLPASTSLAEMEAVGQHYCGEHWSNLRKMHRHAEEEDLLKYCFSTAYIVALLHDRLGIAMQDDRIHFTNKVGKVPLDWALGALIVKLSAENHPSSSEWTFAEDLVTIISFFFLVLFLGIGVYVIHRCRRPKLKTIYDLEKAAEQMEQILFLCLGLIKAQLNWWSIIYQEFSILWSSGSWIGLPPYH